ncbi:hypothetical protein PUN4_780053 [Paraburkholderia unamae]|nr:hypothetical protein PUN4_780053 [Paraburkholderia unamae]
MQSEVAPKELGENGSAVHLDLLRHVPASDSQDLRRRGPLPTSIGMSSASASFSGSGTGARFAPCLGCASFPSVQLIAVTGRIETDSLPVISGTSGREHV